MTITSQSRVHAGVPEGGRFAATIKSEAGLTLDPAGTVDVAARVRSCAVTPAQGRYADALLSESGLKYDSKNAGNVYSFVESVEAAGLTIEAVVEPGETRSTYRVATQVNGCILCGRSSFQGCPTVNIHGTCGACAASFTDGSCVRCAQPDDDTSYSIVHDRDHYCEACAEDRHATQYDIASKVKPMTEEWFTGDGYSASSFFAGDVLGDLDWNKVAAGVPDYDVAPFVRDLHDIPAREFFEIGTTTYASGKLRIAAPENGGASERLTNIHGLQMGLDIDVPTDKPARLKVAVWRDEDGVDERIAAVRIDFTADETEAMAVDHYSDYRTVGRVGVDAARCAFGDAAEMNSRGSEGFWLDSCSAGHVESLIDTRRRGVNALVTSTGWGDGYYIVDELRNGETGELYAVEVEFIGGWYDEN